MKIELGWDPQYQQEFIVICALAAIVYGLLQVNLILRIPIEDVGDFDDVELQP